MSVDEFCRQTLSEPGLWPHIISSKPASIPSVKKTATKVEAPMKSIPIPDISEVRKSVTEHHFTELNNQTSINGGFMEEFGLTSKSSIAGMEQTPQRKGHPALFDQSYGSQ